MERKWRREGKEGEEKGGEKRREQEMGQGTEEMAKDEKKTYKENGLLRDVLREQQGSNMHTHITSPCRSLSSVLTGTA